MEDLPTIALVCIGAVLALLWLLVPFAVFGLRAKVERQAETVDAIAEQLRQTNVLLDQISRQLSEAQSGE